MDIDYLIDRLEALVQTGKRVPLSNKVMLDEQECYALIDQMRAVVPEEIKAAKRTLNDRERILDEADDTARQIIEQAEQERRMMIEQEGLLVEAERQRDIILSEATQEAYELRNHAQSLYDEGVSQTQEMREGANQYAMQVLQELDGLLDKHLTVVRNGLQNFVQQSENYQHQIDEYQRQYRPQYAPSKAELAQQAARSQNNNRPRVTTPEVAPEPERPTPRSTASRPTTSTRTNRPNPANDAPTERTIERPAERPAPTSDRPTNGSASARPVATTRPNPAPTPTPARPATPPNRPTTPPANGNGTSIGDRLTSRPNLSPLRAVPKVSPASGGSDLDDDFDDASEPDFDFDEPRNKTTSSNGVPTRKVPSNTDNRPARPPF